MNTRPDTIRERLQEYEFDDEQELTLTLELLHQIEKDIAEQRARKTRAGFNEYVALAGFAAALFVLLSELGKASQLPLPKVGAIFCIGLLLMKLPWAPYQLVTIDRIEQSRPEKGRFFWSNDLLFEDRVAGLFQLILFLGCAIGVFFLHFPLWISVSTALAFSLYIALLILRFVLSFRREPFRPNSAKTVVMSGLPSLYMITTGAAVIALISRLSAPIGNETSVYAISGMLLTAVFFLDRLIRLSTPPLILSKLERLRYDLIFLRTDLREAWVRYEIIVYGHEISEELRADMEDINRTYDMLEYGQSKKKTALMKIDLELDRLEKVQTQEKITEDHLADLYSQKKEFLGHFEAINLLVAGLNPKLQKIALEIHRISRSTQEWEKADEYHRSILSREAAFNENEKEIAARGGESDSRIKKLEPQPNSAPRAILKQI